LLWFVAALVCLGTALVARSLQETLPPGLSEETLALLEGEERAPAEPGLVSEYPAVSIESLPLHDAPAQAKNSLLVVTRGKLRRGESLSTALRKQGIRMELIHTISSELSAVYDFRNARPGDEYRLGQEAGGQMVDFRYSVGPETSYYLYWTDSGYRVREDKAALRAEVARVGGQIESSLYGTIVELGERAQLASDFADLFAWDIDFSRSVQPGDDFQILFERLYRTNADGEEVYVKPGRILAARYHGRAGEHSAIYFQGERARGSYYRPDGSSVERAFLLAPLKFSRISSSYSTARRHPILNVVRPHRGIDYAARQGTPLWSVGAGTVIFRGWAGGSGNLVKIRHRNGYISYYAHLSRFESGLGVGSVVEQKQIIGYVGDTGLATGPHVCFRLQKNGRYVNPLDISTPAGDPVASGDRARFESARDLLMADLGTGIQMVADEAL
jgi:murein DD-endopeptidase MepM/ murein hydrolase activator NlpD